MKSASVSLGARLLDSLRWLVWVHAGLVAVGLAVAAMKSRVVHVDAWPAQSSDAAIRNLAHLSAGTRLTASSFNAAERLAHPLYAIDGDPKPPLRWASDPTDPAPWLRLRLAKPSNVETLQLVHLKVDKQEAPLGYVVKCLKGDSDSLVPIAQRHVVNDSWSGALQQLNCNDVTEVRIEFDATDAAAANSVGLYEINLLGSAQ